MSRFKPRQGARRASPAVGGRPHKGKTSLLGDHKVRSRVRKTWPPQKMEGNSTQRGATRKWGTGIRQHLIHGLEGGLFLAVGALIVLKNGALFLGDLFLSGWELISRTCSPIEKEFDRLEYDARDHDTDVDLSFPPDPDLSLPPERDLDPDMTDTLPWHAQTISDREGVELAKMSTLATEEADLPEALLDDQAGALRSRLASTFHENPDP